MQHAPDSQPPELTDLKVCDRAAHQKFIGSRRRFLRPARVLPVDASKFGA